MIYDVDRNAIVLFGGANASKVCGGTWAWDDRQNQWQLVTLDGPSARTFPAFAYDEGRHEAILFGGNRVLFGTDREKNTFLGDTWRFKDGRWEHLPGAGPSARAEAAIAYDRERGRLVLFGGYAKVDSGSSTRFGDTWEWDGEQWTKMAEIGPSPRNSAAMTYDEKRKEVILFGGPGPSNETWAWSGHHWTRLQSGETPGRFNPVMVYDSARKTVVRFGGWTGSSRTNDTWTLQENGWSQLDVPGPPARNHSSFAYDRRQLRAILFGGHDGEQVFGDTWSWDGSSWKRLSAARAEKQLDNGH